MDIIPVLDVRGGIVVHARRGERASYAPLRSRLTADSDPAAILRAMLDTVDAIRLHAPAAYVADLDAIVTGTAQWDLLSRLRAASPVPLWVDAGFTTTAAALEAIDLGVMPVVGSESLSALEGLAALAPDAWVLSLDRDSSGPRDPVGILDRPDLWPSRVIAMDLTRVGAATGGVGTWLETCMRASANKMWIAAGGVRDRHDLEALRAAGAAAALVATALHEGSLGD